MKTTLHWDCDGRMIWYKNIHGIWRVRCYVWENSFDQGWKPEDFDKSLTVNNFIEK